MRVSVVALVVGLVVALCLPAAPAFAAAPGAAWAPTFGRALIAASARELASDLKATQAKVDAALKERKKRVEAWRKAADTRDRAAKQVQAMKRAGSDASQLESALARALELDEKAARARTKLLAAEAEVAKGGAELLRLYEALLVERRRAVEDIDATDPQRERAVAAYRELATQRDAVRRALMPLLKEEPAAVAQSTVDLDARPADDVEALLAKADLARDLEDRALRQAEAIAQRVRELEEERAVARDVSGMVGRSQLFDEEDRRLLVIRQDLQGAAATGLSGASRSAASEAPSAPSLSSGAESVDSDDAAVAPTPVGPTLMTAPSAPQPFVETEQGFLGPQTDSTVAGLVSSSSTSLDELRALEGKLRASARELRGRSDKLKAEALKRASDPR